MFKLIHRLFHRKNKSLKTKKEESDMTEDEKQIAEAKTDIAEKGADSQTEKDRIDESVGEQERLDGDKDSQTAKDRVDESEGTKKADEERAEEKKDAAKEDVPAWASAMTASLEKVVGLLEQMAQAAQPAVTADDVAADRIKNAFGQRGGVFDGNGTAAEEKKMSPADVQKIISKLM